MQLGDIEALGAVCLARLLGTRKKHVARQNDAAARENGERTRVVVNREGISASAVINGADIVGEQMPTSRICIICTKRLAHRLDAQWKVTRKSGAHPVKQRKCPPPSVCG